MTLAITPIYAAILGLMLIALTVAVVAKRARTGINLFHETDMMLGSAIRRHGNFIELVPMALILMAMAELAGTPAGWLHAMGATLVLARAVHPFGINPEGSAVAARIVGSVGTWVVMLAAIAMILSAAI